MVAGAYAVIVTPVLLCLSFHETPRRIKMLLNMSRIMELYVAVSTYLSDVPSYILQVGTLETDPVYQVHIQISSAWYQCVSYVCRGF